MEEYEMKSSLAVGVSYTHRVTINRERTISFMGEEGRVYGTPFMVLDMEHTCRDLIMQHADAGEDSVGIEIATTHIAATPLGWNVEITAKVVAVEGRKVTFELTAKDELEPIGKGTHSRVVVDVAKTQERLKAKQARRPAKTG
jgi:predicted thioesterase